MRHRLLALLLLALPLSSAAQFKTAAEFNKERGLANLLNYDRKPLHFGFLVGFALLDFHVYNSGLRTPANEGNAWYADVAKLDVGIVLGIVTDFRITDQLHFRILPGISFGQRHLLYVDETGHKIGSEYDEGPIKLKSTFVEAPCLFKYGAKRLHNWRPFVVAGATPRFDLAKDKQEHLRMRSLDIYASGGLGIDVYLPYFRLGVEFRGDWGLTNVYADKQSEEPEDICYAQAIKRMKSQWWGFLIYFE